MLTVFKVGIFWEVDKTILPLLTSVSGYGPEVTFTITNFVFKMYQLELMENAQPGFIITTVHAEDADSGTFGDLRYFLPGTGNNQVALDLVTVDSITGEVTLKQSLDREKHNK